MTSTYPEDAIVGEGGHATYHNDMRDHLAALQAAFDSLSTNTLGPGRVLLNSFSGSDAAAKLRNAWNGGEKRLIIVEPGTTIDAGASPIVIPDGGSLGALGGGETEFSDNCRVNIRMTGQSTSTGGVFTTASGANGWKFVNIGFEGLSTVNAFKPNPMDASGEYFRYCQWINCSWDGFNQIAETPAIGFQIMGICYMNNFALRALKLAGSDCQLFTNGGYLEQNGTQSYATKAAQGGLLRFGSTQKYTVGPLYITGSPQVGVWVESGNGGIDFEGIVAEGRESHSGGTLHCAGAIMRLAGGGGTIRPKWVGYAMRDPNATARNDAGYIHISGGNWTIEGGSWQRYSDVAKTVPLVAVEGANTRVRCSNMMKSSSANWAAADVPVVLQAQSGLCTIDTSVGNGTTFGTILTDSGPF